MNRFAKVMAAGALAAAATGTTAAPALAYGSGTQYNVELSANLPGKTGGGAWLWIALDSNGTGNYSGADCGHGGVGASSDKGTVTWTTVGGSVIIEGVLLNGFGGFPTTITVPAAYGHYTGNIASFLTLPFPVSGGFSQLQVAH